MDSNEHADGRVNAALVKMEPYLDWDSEACACKIRLLVSETVRNIIV